MIDQDIVDEVRDRLLGSTISISVEAALSDMCNDADPAQVKHQLPIDCCTECGTWVPNLVDREYCEECYEIMNE